MHTKFPRLALALLIIGLAGCFPPEEELEDDTNNAVGDETNNGDDDDFNNTANNDSADEDSCEFANDGECDEPDLCAPGTDTADCDDAAPPPDNGGSGDSYTLGGLTITTPEVVLESTTEGLTLEDVSLSGTSSGRVLFGGWVTNNSEQQLCFVKFRDSACTMSDGTLLADCVNSFVMGEVGTLSSDVTTGTCMNPGQSYPIADSIRLPNTVEEQEITQISLTLDASSADFGTPLSSLEVDGALELSGSNSFQARGSIINNGEVDAFVERATFRVLLIDDLNHIVSLNFARAQDDELIIAPGESIEVETRGFNGLTVEDDIAEVFIHLDWEDVE